jgi:hypothetical protein
LFTILSKAPFGAAGVARDAWRAMLAFHDDVRNRPRAVIERPPDFGCASRMPDIARNATHEFF